MFCPRCGAPNPETTKFCRQCGLGLTQVSSYVSTGGTAQLTPGTPSPVSQIAQITAGYTPKQKMVLSILCLVFLPGFLAIMSDMIGFADALVPVAGIFMCVGIPWAVIHFRNQQRLLDQQQWHAQMQMQQMPMNVPLPPHAPPVQQYLQPPMQQPVQMPVQQPGQQSYAPQPGYQAPHAAPPANSPNTNLLGTAPSSVTEDETRRLHNQ
ncbi:MAG: zinc ribbon domain-containing protein [Acidobacteria bacterium]|nr:zinc ribbon domain-containing protein [Acidobacteriota bacterium]MBI3424698.1 zinc ribbon domain-containing protein [Acidobacteriota bacterium]